ncbi:hypothetical protein [Streptomyces jumonjinensis]|uniref:hypothetical protein n=1 Tax=Streptomyces jumonjinensis TaxID=1945 RepID=UPI0037A20844
MPDDVTPADIRAARREGDLRTLLRHLTTQAATEAEQRRALVMRHPDLADRITQLIGPGWNGYLAPPEWRGTLNTSPIRARLAEIITEAERRAGQGREAAA